MLVATTYRHPVAIHQGKFICVFRKPAFRLELLCVLAKVLRVIVLHPMAHTYYRLFT